MLLGFTEIDAVGAGGGGGGGGGGATFFLQAPNINSALNPTTRKNHFMDCFTFLFLLRPQSCPPGPDEVIYYFQLQFGCELRPVNVNC